jgi:ABC-type Co2+ transport system permease subunit
MLGPYAIANLIMLVAIIVAVVFQPKFGDPNSYLPAAIEAGLLLVAGIFVVKGTLRLRQVRRSGREDERRISAGLPLDPEEHEDTTA